MASVMLGRGCRYFSSVSLGSAAHFRAYTKAASAYLAEHKKQCAGDPGWYALAAAAGGRLGWDATDMLAVVDEGMAKYPGYTMIAFEAVKHFSPKRGWHAVCREIHGATCARNRAGARPPCPVVARGVLSVALLIHLCRIRRAF